MNSFLEKKTAFVEEDIEICMTLLLLIFVCSLFFFEIESLNTFEIGYILVSLDIYVYTYA